MQIIGFGKIKGDLLFINDLKFTLKDRFKELDDAYYYGAFDIDNNFLASATSVVPAPLDQDSFTKLTRVAMVSATGKVTKTVKRESNNEGDSSFYLATMQVFDDKRDEPNVNRIFFTKAVSEKFEKILLGATVKITGFVSLNKQAPALSDSDKEKGKVITEGQDFTFNLAKGSTLKLVAYSTGGSLIDKPSLDNIKIESLDDFKAPAIKTDDDVPTDVEAF